MALEAFRGGKMVFSGSSRVVLEFLEWLEGLWHKGQRSHEIWGFFWDFGDFLEDLKWVRTYSQIVFRNQGPCCKFSKCSGTVAQFTTKSGAPCKIALIYEF
jgi:hypothetical protein